MRVLIVDDDQMICNGTARRLEKCGIADLDSICCAYSGEEALSIFQKETVHVLFSDIRMNGMTGLELIQAAKQLQPYTVCVVVTAYDQFQYAQQAIRVGVHDFLVKPCSGREMREQALHAVNCMTDTEPRRRRLLDEALCAAVRQAGAPVNELFRYYAMEAPEQLRLVRFSSPDVRWKPQPGWSYHPLNADFALIAANVIPPSTESNVLGISDAGSNLCALYQQACEQSSSNHQIVVRAQQYVQGHLCEPLDMAMVANVMNLSYSYFSRIFHEETGMPFSKYLQRLRLEEAGRRLLSGEKLVDIATHLHYQNAANLSRAFAKEIGLSPSQWVEQQTCR